MLEYFITSKTKRKLLKLLLMNPEKTFYVREMEKLTHEPINAVRRELSNLEKAGLLITNRYGNRKFFKVNKNFPFLSELKSIIYSTIGLGDYLQEHLNTAKSIEFAFIYGSIANGKEMISSDIDMFLVGTISERELHKVITDLEKQIGRDINYTLMSKKEFTLRSKKNDPFIKRILEEDKIMLKGKLNDDR